MITPNVHYVTAINVKGRNRTTPTKAERKLATRQADFDAGGSPHGFHPNQPIPGTKRPGSLNRKNS